MSSSTPHVLGSAPPIILENRHPCPMAPYVYDLTGVGIPQPHRISIENCVNDAPLMTQHPPSMKFWW